ncbi:hypothetical protein B0A48_16947 [Cryoendolithus antarcticus]|uniref:Integral membrane bound transporter domain-containing protein n=1 Tax=Cryoendolithus antarcticus TaxID=1507870 RepID=A0A1V8SD06_9PEZI|nr:hypothetical protein B0A48_16947 [Cryoendolithus antarcticus]
MAPPGPSSDKRSRRILRTSTFIAPATGERVKRVFSLRDASSRDLEADLDEHQPLLGYAVTDKCETRLSRVTDKARQYANHAWAYSMSPTGLGIFKCSLAYLLASMATFVPAISNLIGKQDSKNIVATVTVWFHPARTIGSMHEALVLALIAFSYATFLSFSSMGLSVLLGQYGLLQLSHALDLVLFCGVGLGFIAFTKQYFNHPLVNVACSLASLGSVQTLVKEGSVQVGQFSQDKIAQIMIMVIMGIAATMLINVAVLPVRARRQLHDDLEKNTDLMGEVLVTTTRAFLLGEEDVLNEGKGIMDEHSKVATSMKTNLIEAKREHFVLGTERQYHLEAKLVDCLDRLAQDLGGLRSAASTQFSILHKAYDHAAGTKSTTSPSASGASTPNGAGSMLRHSSISRATMLDAIQEDPAEVEEDDSPGADEPWTSTNGSNTTSQAAKDIDFKIPNYSNGDTSTGPPLSPADMFVMFINLLGPPAKSLTYTVKQILDDLKFDEDGTVVVNAQFATSLRQAMEMYKQSRTDALASLYRSKTMSREHPDEVLADLEEVAASCGHFSFALLDFVEDVAAYLQLLDEEKHALAPGHTRRTWNWLKFWRHHDREHAEQDAPRFHHDHLETGDPVGDIAETVKQASHSAQAANAPDTHAWYYPIYKATRVLQQDNVRFPTKVGIGAALYCLPAYLPETRPFFTHWRGEWGLLSYMVVCSMTIGASNTTGINRLIGTLIGAGLAVLAWLMSNNGGEANPYLLAFLGWLVSLGCFYIIIEKNNGPMGRFVLLTYNLGALYAYSLSVLDTEDDDDEGGIDPAIWEIVLHRVVSVIVGSLWGLVITMFIWPISARRKLRDGLCVLWLRMSLVWKRDPLTMILQGGPTSSYMDIREEAELQTFVAYLSKLKDSAVSEFELRGPFPDEQMKRIIERTKKMLEAFHAMNVVISKNLRATPGETAVLKATREERFALSSRISHLFSVLSSSLKLEYPLNDALPNIEDRRDRLLAKVFEFRRSHGTSEGSEGGAVEFDEADFELIYAYVLVTGQLADDLAAVRSDLETLLGTLDEEHLKLQ